MPSPVRASCGAPKLGHLPPPFDDIRFEWDASDRYITADYFGDPESLIACGAIEPPMVEKRKKGEPKPRRDSAGHQFISERKVIRHPLSVGLRITRYIFDPRFAETLPGIPRGLRFKRLDWLDSHRGSVHTTTERSENGSVHIIVAGTRDNLIVAGIPESCFRSKFLEREGYSHFVSGRELLPFEDASGRITRLMRGYYEIDVRHDESKKPIEIPAFRSACAWSFRTTRCSHERADRNHRPSGEGSRAQRCRLCPNPRASRKSEAASIPGSSLDDSA